ncbi:hypothetical protein EJB05_19832 [Eragrostis curvula]|uniref:Uncharacterized protein n=1 Tax=Eragrostis curvula TaxID=38414 RepID=A0A5J9UYJ4_9POAL|nr:hypothetical protein EJB05_19832 [Eragrostis curvula]
MASQHQGENDEVASVGSPGEVLPLDALKPVVPRCEDDLDIPDCARYTIDACIVEATARLIYESANAAVRGNRKVISGEDMEGAIERVEEKDTVLDSVKKEMNAILEARKRAARIRKAREERKRKAKEAVERRAREAAAERMAEAERMAWEEAAMAEREDGEEAPATPEDAGSSTSAGFQK